jgi:lipoprotein-anchoring transpeptidase ErfK/SrfK
MMCLTATAVRFAFDENGVGTVARARHRRGGRWVVAAVMLGVLAIVTAGTAFAAYQYDASTSDRILPGVSVGGVDVSGMKRDEAVRTLRELAEQTLYSELVVQAAGHSWNVTPASLGMTAGVEGAVTRAFAVADEQSLPSRVYHRLRDVPVDVSLDLRFDEHRREVKAFVQQAFDEVALPAVDARFALVDGELVTNRSHTGRELAIGAATDRILEALGGRTDAVEVPVRTVEPSVTTAALGQSIVVDLSENHLYLYDGLKVVADYPVATAAAGYSTPVGNWEVVDKRENPTWYNPALDSWGADLPPTIAPGPGNPLGTRAIYLNAPGIRIHGTYSSSSIGTYASHGCIRMYISDSEELFDRVDMGTRVIIKP